jgi:hypothetical protein
MPSMFAYRAPTGAQLTIVRGRRPFPEASRARKLHGTEDGWTVRSSGGTIICAQGTHAMLLLGPLLFDMMEHVSLVVPGLAAVAGVLSSPTASRSSPCR